MSTEVATNLQSQLDAYREKFLTKASQDKIDAFQNGVDELSQTNILEKALKKGDKAINFALSDALGNGVALYDHLARGPVVLTWYRGGWCPYCNLQLRAYQQQLPAFKERNATLIALTPELPDRSLSTQEKHDLQFKVLTDLNNKVAKQYGLVFQVPPEVMNYYNQAFDLEAYNGNEHNELPLAATYVIDQSGVITYAYLDADYRNRAEPQELLQALDRLG